ncbi:AAA family ATPase [Aeromonas hydrophila]
MLKKYKIENFKAFSSAESLELSNITLVFGQNSSGKSSIIQSIMLLKQTLLGSDPHAGLIPEGDCISLGEHRTLINKHDLKLDIHFSLDFENQLSIEKYQEYLKQIPPFGSLENRNISLTYSYYEQGKESVSFLNKLEFSAANKNSKTPTTSFCLANRKQRSGNVHSESSYRIIDESVQSIFKFIKNKEERSTKLSFKEEGFLFLACNDDFRLSNDLSLPIKSINHEGGDKVNNQLNRIFSEVKYELSKIKYLGPLRSYPKRFYSARQGKNYLGKSDFSNIFSSSKGELINKINYWFDKFEMPYIFSVENVGNEVTGNIISIQLTDKRNNTTVTPADVGFGIGQVLPIIIESIVNRDAIICVEQPEIHLHPRLQAHLADLFIESIENNNQWIIETHSEALMLRIQKRIRMGVIDKDAIKVVYVQAGDSGSSIQNLPLDDKGNFLVHWPEGFFEERMHEIFGA